MKGAAVGDTHRNRFVVPVQGGSRRGRSGVPGAVHQTSTSLQSLWALFEHAPLGVAVSSLDGRFTNVNERFRKLLDGSGIDPDASGLPELAGHLPRDGGDASGWREALDDVRGGRTPVATAELVITQPDERLRWVEVAAAAVDLGSRRVLLSRLEDTTGRHLAGRHAARSALYDGLTGLPGRTLLSEELALALTGVPDGEPGLGVLSIDLDGFGAVNEALGRSVGDHLLVAVARRLSSSLRAGDVVGRLDDDEFLVIAQGVVDEDALGEVTRRVGAALSEPWDVGPHSVRMTASIGTTVVSGGDLLGAVLRRASRAMFLVKRSRHSAPDIALDVRDALPHPTPTRQTQPPSPNR
jgi:diguanylate cyclase (GGDEF)-like protein